MTVSSLPPDPQRRTRTGTTLLGAVLVLLGPVAIAALLLTIGADPAVRAALEPTAGTDGPSLTLAVLDGFGLILPALVLLLGGVTAALGVGGARRDAAVLRLTRDAAAWAVLATAGLTVMRLLQGESLVVMDGTLLARATSGVLPLALTCALSVALRLGLAHAAEVPDLPHEPLFARERRAAWNLLLPALLILLVVAARPLEGTIITSLTDKRFASAQATSFVGLQHYRELLTVGVDQLACRTDDAGACLRSAQGQIRWDTLPVERLREGYRTVWTWNLPLVTAPDRALSLTALDQDWIRSIWVTVVFTVFSVSGELLIGLFMALAVHSSFAGRGVMRAVMLIPWAIPTVVSARLWEVILKDTSAGVLNSSLMTLGLIDAPQAWLTTSALQLPSIIAIDVWKTAPFMALLLLAGLQTIPRELYESARVDGAGRVREFFAITLPLLRPAIAVALIFRTLDALRVFDLFQVLFGRSQHSVSTYNFEVLINNQEAGYASAVGVLIFLLIFGFAVAYVRVLGVNRS
ncbi:MAG: sugar ABC transporter permease [Trueperaceae bacterium]